MYFDLYVNCDFLFQSAVGWEYQSGLSKHESQTDAAKGFGGKYGVQKDRQDEVNTSMHYPSCLTCVVMCTSILKLALTQLSIFGDSDPKLPSK